MIRQLTPEDSLEHLRKEAKRWLKALRAGDSAARERLARAWPEAPAAPGLRDLQHALAREYGLEGWTALREAVAHLDGVGSQPERALHELLDAANRGDAAAVAAVLERHPTVVNERGTLEGHSGLRTALHFGSHSAPVVRALLERGADPNVRDEGDNAFPLHFVAERGDLDVARLLVEHGAQTVAGEVDDHELDIIGWATCFPGVETNAELVRYLLEHGARHTLFSAVAVGATDVIRERVRENPADLNRPMHGGVTRRRRALHLAVTKEQPGSLETLLDLGADPDAQDAGGMTALDEAAVRGHREMVETLLRAGATATLPAAIALGREDLLQDALRADADVLKPGHRWATLIVRAAADAPAPFVERLLALGADPNIVDDTETSIDGTRGFTALHAAAWRGSVEVIDLLLTHGADPRRREARYRGTPAGWAQYANKQDAFERLLQADLDIFDAIFFDQLDRIPEILRRDPAALHRPFSAYLPAGAAAAEDAEIRLTPLDCATKLGKPQAVRMLQVRGAELLSGGHLARTHEDRVEAFLRMACIEGVVGGSERIRQMHAAVRLLRRYPEIARENIYTAVACGEMDVVRALLGADPRLATQPGGPRHWPPLLYFATSRLPGHAPAAENAVDIARVLLDAGADPNASYAGGDETIRYTVLASVIGRGEEQTPQHPRARELAALLLDRGAEPYDIQVFYNAFGGHASYPMLADDDLVWLLELIYQASVKRGRQADWQDPEWRMIDMGGYGFGADYLQRRALQGNHQSIVDWVVAHGGAPLRDAADGATTPAARLFSAADHDDVELARRLLGEGVSPDVENKGKARPLHAAAWAGSLRVAQLLIDRGAGIDPRDGSYGTTPIYWALFGQRWAMVDLLTPHSRDVWALVAAGKVDRLRELLAAEPHLAQVSWEGGTPLFMLPDDEAAAAEIVRMFLASGADRAFRRRDGATAYQLARARGLDEAAMLLNRR